MSTWTWTFVRVDKLSKEQLESCIAHATWLRKSAYGKKKLNDKRIGLYGKCLNGEISLEDVLKETKQLNGALNDFYVIERDGKHFVKIYNEIFRNRISSEKEFHTVDSLIEHLKKPGNACILDYYKEGMEWENILSPELEQKIREYYGKIGDNNFYVHFG